MPAAAHGQATLCCTPLTFFALPPPPLSRPQVIPIIDIPGFGTAAAEKVCTDMKIQSQVGAVWGKPHGSRATVCIMKGRGKGQGCGNLPGMHVCCPALATRTPGVCPLTTAPTLHYFPPTHDRPLLLQNDTKKLAEAKQLVYLKGFTDGVLIVGEYAGKKVRGGLGLARLRLQGCLQPAKLRGAPACMPCNL